LNISFNIALPSTPRFSKWSLSFMFPHWNAVCICFLSNMCCMPRPSHSPWFELPNKLSRLNEVRSWSRFRTTSHQLLFRDATVLATCSSVMHEIKTTCETVCPSICDCFSSAKLLDEFWNSYRSTALMVADVV
jgi:hypothetical protein